SAPSVPTGLSGTATSMTTVDLSWTASTDNVGVAGYRVFCDGVQVGTTSAVSYSDTGLTKSTAYSYSVLAYDAAGNPSAQTAPVSVTTLSDTSAPSVPTGLSGTAVSMTAIDLSWTASTDNIAVTGYKVFRNGTQIADVTTGTTYSDTGLTQNTSYSYTVLAYDAAGNSSAQTSGVSVKTLAKTYSLSDFTALVSVWLQSVTNNPSDVNSDGVVNTRDIGIMMSSWQ
ncbi:MAG: fibronectin type III domain-containing protein, partial [Candidatus Moraniibacteriota bacterium]